MFNKRDGGFRRCHCMIKSLSQVLQECTRSCKRKKKLPAGFEIFEVRHLLIRLFALCRTERKRFAQIPDVTRPFPAAGACIWVRCFGSWLSLSNSPSNSVKMACRSF